MSLNRLLGKNKGEMKQKGGVTTKVGNPEQKRTVNDRTIEIIRRLSIRSSLAKKRHGRHRKRIRGEQVNGALKQGEAREAHRLSRTLAGRGMGARRRPLPRIPAIRQCSEERAKHPQTSPSTKVDAMDCESCLAIR